MLLYNLYVCVCVCVCVYFRGPFTEVLEFEYCKQYGFVAILNDMTKWSW